MVVGHTRSHNRVVRPPPVVELSIVVYGEVISGLAGFVVLVALRQADLGAEGDDPRDVIDAHGRAP